MSSKVPTIRRIAWISLFPQFLVMGLIMLIWHQFDQTNFVWYGALTYLLISQVTRRTLTRAHRKGMLKVHAEKYEEAIPLFEKSYDFFKRNNWIDQYRYVTLLSSSAMTYKEMALNNIAFCYGQLGDGQKAKAYYERTLREFPHNGLAKAGLNMLNATMKEKE